jgi:hypothetical protein
VDVAVGIADGTAVEVGEGIVAVALTLVLTTITGASVTPVAAQDARISGKRRFKICFMRTYQPNRK